VQRESGATDYPFSARSSKEKPRMINTKRLCTVEQFLAAHPWLTKGRFRELLFRRHENGLDIAIVEFGRTLLIDSDKFASWFDANFCERLAVQDAEGERHE